MTTVARPKSTTVPAQKPIECVLEVFPDARESKYGWYSARCRGHNDQHASLSFREKENGGVILRCHAGCAEEQILAGAGLQARDLYPQGSYRPRTQTRPKLELIDLAYDKGLPWQVMFNEGVNDGYNYHGQSVVTIDYPTADGQKHPKVRVRLGLSGKDSKWDEDTPGEMIAYGLHRLAMARQAGYLLVGEGESDAWTCWFHNIPYLGVPGAANEKCLNGADLQDIPGLYIIREPDSAGVKFYKRVHAQLRKTGYTGKIFALLFKDVTGCKDPNELHQRILKEKHATFTEAMAAALQKAIPDNASTDKRLLGSGHAAIDAAIRSGDKETLYYLASEIVKLSPLDRQRMRLDIRSVWGKEFPLKEFDDLIKEEDRKILSEQNRRPTIKSARDLMATTFAPIDWIAKEVIPPGVIALAGKQKIGKSWLMLNAAYGVSSGSQIFGNVQVKRGNVLYMALEDNERRMQDRLKVLNPQGSVMLDEFEYVTKWPRMDADGLIALETWITSRPNPRLIIIDPWVKVKPRMRTRAGETGYDTDYEALEGIKQLADTYNVCILILFHLRKAEADDPFDELNATTGVTACADGFLSLKRGRSESEATLWGTGRDYPEDVDMALTFDKGIWTYAGKGSEVALSQASKEVIDILTRAKEPLQPKDVTELLGMSPMEVGKIRKRLFDMKERGEVLKTDIGYIPNKDYIPSNKGNGGNASNGGNGGNASNGHSQESVTSTPKTLPPLPSQNSEVTPLNQPIDGSQGESVTFVTSTHNNNNGHFRYPADAMQLAGPEPIGKCHVCKNRRYMPRLKGPFWVWSCAVCHPEVERSQGQEYHGTFDRGL